MDEERHIVYLGARAVLLGLVGLLWLTIPPVVWSQSASSKGRSVESADWQLILDGERAEWPNGHPDAPVDSVRQVGDRLMRTFWRDGYYYARVDSATLDTSASGTVVRLHVHRGPEIEVGRIQIEGADAVSEVELRQLLETEVGDPLDPRRLEADIEAVLNRYEEAGHPLAEVRIAEADIASAPRTEMQLTIAIEEGPALWLQSIEAPDDARTSPGLLARLAHLEVGEPLVNYDPEAIQRRLDASAFFDSVGRPRMKVTPEGGAILEIPVEEAPPGSFNLALGYLPPSGPGEGGQLVGTGRLLLEHLFGGGRRLDLTLDRRPGQTSLFNLSVSDPYILGLPLRLTGQFEGEQRDSTYGERAYGGEVGYRVHSDFELTGQVQREVVRPGQAGITFRNGRQQIPRSEALFYGVGLRYEGVDRRVNPRQGLRLEVTVEQGQQEETVRRIGSAGDTLRVDRSHRQERFTGMARSYVPLFDRQVLVIGADGSVVRSPQYDRSDLFRMGGATSLRGYDEDRFLGNVTARGLLEYRLQLDRRSYAYLFGDVGYVARPALRRTEPSEDWYPGYGLGIQIQTAIGLIETTYALNPEATTPANGRIHFGLSVGL